MHRSTQYVSPRHIVAATAALLAGSAVALPNEVNPQTGRGMAQKWPVAVVVDGYLGLKDDTDPSSAPVTSFPQNAGLEFGIGGLVNGLNGLGAGSGGPIDAISSGNAIVPSASEGLPNVGGGNWLALTLTVTNSTVTPSVLFGHGGSVGGSLVTHYDARSELIHGSLPGTTRLDKTSEDLGLGAIGDVEGVDYGLGLLAFGAKVAKPTILRTNDMFFFSVTRDFAINSSGTPFAWNPASQTFVDANPADVYLVQRSGTTWSPPTVYVDHADLGFTDDPANGVFGDIDSLDIDPATGIVFFSPTAEAEQLMTDPTYVDLPSQLMLVDLALDTGAFQHAPFTHAPFLRRESGNKVQILQTAAAPGATPQPMESEFVLSTVTSTNGHEVNGLCGIDPEIETVVVATPVRSDRQPYVQSPITGHDTVIRAEHASLSAYRRESDSGPLFSDWTIALSGWGRAHPRRSTAKFEYRLLDERPSGLVVVQPWTSAGLSVRNWHDEEVEFTLESVPSVSGIGLFQGDRGLIEFRGELMFHRGDWVPTLESEALLFDETP